MADFGDIKEGAGSVLGGVGRGAVRGLQATGNIFPGVRQGRTRNVALANRQELLNQAAQQKFDIEERRREEDRDQRDVDRRISLWKGLEVGSDRKKQVGMRLFKDHFPAGTIPDDATDDDLKDAITAIQVGMKDVRDAKTPQERTLAQQNMLTNIADLEITSGPETRRRLQAAEETITGAFPTVSATDQPVPSDVARSLGIPEGANLTFGQASTLGFKVSTPATTTAQNYLLPGAEGQVVLSHDGGRTYTDARGVSRPLPSGTIRVPQGASLAEVKAQSRREQAKKELAEGRETKATTTFRESAEDAARGGTGPYATLAAATDAIFGGLGVDVVFGKEGLFPDTQKNRQFLRVMKQTGKEALLNSSRGATWEQEKIDRLFPNPDKIFTNPRTEAGKLGVLRDTLAQEREFNLQQIATSQDPKEIAKLEESNLQVDRLLNLLGAGESQTGGAGDVGAAGVTTRVQMPDGSVQTFDAAGKRIQ